MDPKSGRAGFALALVLALAALGAAPIPAVACSCAMPGPLAVETFDPTTNAVLIGTVGADEPRGVRVNVQRWFAGDGQAPVVWLDAENFAPERMGGACGIARLPVGTVWIMNAYGGDDGLFGVHLCSRQAQLATLEGQTMVAEARAAFGEGMPFGVGGAPVPGGDLFGTIVGMLLGILRLLLGR